MSEPAVGWRRKRRARSPAEALVVVELTLALPWLLALAWLLGR